MSLPIGFSFTILDFEEYTNSCSLLEVIQGTFPRLGNFVSVFEFSEVVVISDSQLIGVGIPGLKVYLELNGMSFKIDCVFSGSMEHSFISHIFVQYPLSVSLLPTFLEVDGVNVLVKV